MTVSLNYELISGADYDKLPLDPEDCFVELEAICRRNMTRMIDENTSSGFDAIVRSQYMGTVSASAQECGITDINYVYDSENDYDTFAKFNIAVQGAVARIRIRKRRSLNSQSVQLLSNTRTKIEHHILRLRTEIDNSDLSTGRKKALSRKLDELVVELANPRLDLGKACIVLSSILFGLAAATTVSADGPTAITNIMRLIGQDRETEEAAMERLAPPPKALPAPPASHRSITPAWETAKGDALDDEIPF